MTLDHLSNGRAMLGVGLGEPPDSDFSDLGDEADARVRALDEGLDIISRILSGERVDHDGAEFQVHGELKPAAVQQPRPPIFVAGVAYNQAPLRRALRWDGFFPIGHESFLAPADLARYLDGVDRPANWDLFAARVPGHSPAEFETVGVTWLVEGCWPMGGWVEELSGRIKAGPLR